MRKRIGSSKYLSESEWRKKWFDAVTENSMTQRALKSIEKYGGGVKTLTTEAKKRKIHLLLLESDKGEKIVAASLKKFTILS